jgi:hypothetical protein
MQRITIKIEEIDVSMLEKGIYVLELETPKGKVVKKVVIE